MITQSQQMLEPKHAKRSFTFLESELSRSACCPEIVSVLHLREGVAIASLVCTLEHAVLRHRAALSGAPMTARAGRYTAKDSDGAYCPRLLHHSFGRRRWVKFVLSVPTTRSAYWQ